MRESRAIEIERKVFDSFVEMIPHEMDAEDAFQIGKMVGMMRAELRSELKKEIGEDTECRA